MMRASPMSIGADTHDYRPVSRLAVAYYGSSDPHTPREKCEKSLVPESVITEFVLGVAHVAELADALDSGSSE